MRIFWHLFRKKSALFKTRNKKLNRGQKYFNLKEINSNSWSFDSHPHSKLVLKQKPDLYYILQSWQATPDADQNNESNQINGHLSYDEKIRLTSRQLYLVSAPTWQDSFPLSSTPRMMLCLRRVELTKARHFSSFLLSQK